MSGRLRTSFRSGNLAEHLGFFLLKGIAAVAEVPRTEDVGIDAVANLLRPDKDGNSYAEDSFIVQLKSESERSIKYDDHNLSWLLNQSQPMFIGCVSLKKSCISLYSTLHINQAVLAMHSEKITVKFGKSPNDYPWAKKSVENSATVWLGDPLLSWTIYDMANAMWLSNAYAILKQFLTIARHEYVLLSFGQCSKITWCTNNKDSIQSPFLLMKGNHDDLQIIAEQCKPGLKSLLFHAIMMPEKSRNSLVIPLISLIGPLRDLGIDIDPSNLFTKLFAYRLKSLLSDDNDENHELNLYNEEP